MGVFATRTTWKHHLKRNIFALVTVYVHLILFTFYNVGEKRKLWTGVRAAELLCRFTSCFQVDAKAPNVVTSRRCLGENGTEFLESACRTCSMFIFRDWTSQIVLLSWWRQRQRQRHRSMIWLVERRKIIVLHVRHAFWCNVKFDVVFRTTTWNFHIGGSDDNGSPQQ